MMNNFEVLVCRIKFDAFLTYKVSISFHFLYFIQIKIRKYRIKKGNINLIMNNI